MKALAIMLIAAGIAAPAGGELIGNGRLTAVVDPFGSVMVCRWPGPAMNDQLGERGAGWGVRTDRKTEWFGENAAEISTTSPGTPAISEGFFVCGAGRVVQRSFVAPDDDVLVSRVQLFNGNNGPPEFVWRADFSPRPRVLPELAGLARLGGADFAGFVSDGRVYQFRPQNVSGRDWAAAERALADPADWDHFDHTPGVWVVSASSEAAGAACAPDMSAQGAVGECRSVLWINPAEDRGSYKATVFTAFGSTRQDAEQALERAMAEGFDELYEKNKAYWTSFAGANKRLAEDLVTLGLSVDRETGAFARDPAGGAHLPICYLRDTAWASLALDLAGHPDIAARVLKFAVSTLRTEQTRGKPLGSLPLAVYGTGVEALPHLALDADAPAYVLGALWRHADAISDETARLEFIEEVWEEAALMADFLAGWTDSRNREPLYSFDYRMGRDRQDDDRLLTTFMGIDAALRMARAADRTEPEHWARRKVELDAMVRFQLVDREEKTWKSTHILPYWHDLMEEDWVRRGPPLPSWDAALLRIIDAPDDPQPAKTAAAAALVWRGEPEYAQYVNRALINARAAHSHDALAAAQRLVANLKPAVQK